ncbi:MULTISPECIES: DUF4097 family beta strand repeat-containing protein [Staphylococcus]|jgi:hypothetical protein|uniref:DUF4097 family beta strand repeat protein n=3 Tax=Staphylococcus nepalensis TaxID=214473 RepID=A0A2T4S873_9STAP|nr:MULTISPECIES: DUF4097 family beta strand repeat-containing protein [Staphylococcus]VDG66645.1 Uncharacterised protein [Lacrimispora indolis]MBO1206888.1 DUF4097 family beta strand repeat protein [Staphylococcus nepalensis]MBO1213068.1 DUF4097 family beta strand repeat protein [Staphylococcus nepalensis]MBO1217171.1 DUF4097 family beta strand repeat protein [Staphylococcus nepalensis]MBO1222436.1 DUF4097 family beta strand repeat protein [Staphylococcus nepalensis]
MKRLFIGGLGLFIICFLIGSIAWFGFEKQNEKLNTVNKVLNTNDIKNLDVLTENCKVLIKSGGQTSIKYKGKRNIDIKEVDNTLKVKETKELENHYGLNFNPFRQFDDHLIITLPKEKLNKLKLSSSYNSINIKNLNIKSAEISKNNKNGGKVNIDKTKFEKLLYKGVNSQIKLDDSEVINADIKTENARILSENSLIQKSVLLANHSNIYLSDIDVNSNFKASTKKGDINISYKQAPNNILLKLYPVHGTTNINNSRFVNDRVGNGDNILELYTNDGDINID